MARAVNCSSSLWLRFRAKNSTAPPPGGVALGVAAPRVAVGGKRLPVQAAKTRAALSAATANKRDRIARLYYPGHGGLWLIT